jgi:hypothetical protein
MEGSGYRYVQKITDPDPGTPKTYGSYVYVYVLLCNLPFPKKFTLKQVVLKYKYIYVTVEGF